MKTSVIVTGIIAGMGLLALALSIRADGGNAAQNITPTFTTSRYLLFSGSFREQGAGTVSGEKMEQGVFKLDTYSGDTWMLEVKANSEGSPRNMRWVSISNAENQQKSRNMPMPVNTGRLSN